MHTKTGKVCIQKAKLGNQNAAGHGAPEGNKNAEKYGFFSKYLPDETREIFSAIEEADPLDLLWHSDTTCVCCHYPGTEDCLCKRPGRQNQGKDGKL